MSALHSIAFVTTVVVLFVANLLTFLVPNPISLGGTILALLLSPFGPGFSSAFAGVLVAGGTLLLVGEAYLRLRGTEGLGMGCVKAAAMVGAFVGWELAIAVLVVSFANGGLLAVLSALSRREVKLIPCGALLAIGAAVVFVATAVFPDLTRAL